MIINVGSIFPENGIYIYKDGIMKKTTTTSLFSYKKAIVIGMPGALHALLTPQLNFGNDFIYMFCLLYTSPSPRD